jgi:hypothetical protein
MKHEKGNDLLLSRTWQTGRDLAFDEDAEPAKEFDAQGWSNYHLPMVHIFNRGRSSRLRLPVI